MQNRYVRDNYMINDLIHDCNKSIKLRLSKLGLFSSS